MISVTVVSVTTTKDPLGNTTTTETSTVYDKCRFAPRSSQERSDSRSPAVITGGTLYRRGELPVDSDDRIVISGQSDLIDGTWQVEGDPGYWGRGTEVAIKRVV